VPEFVKTTAVEQDSQDSKGRRLTAVALAGLVGCERTGTRHKKGVGRLNVLEVKFSLLLQFLKRVRLRIGDCSPGKVEVLERVLHAQSLCRLLARVVEHSLWQRVTTQAAVTTMRRRSGECVERGVPALCSCWRT
jgi:hypothetical protein